MSALHGLGAFVLRPLSQLPMSAGTFPPSLPSAYAQSRVPRLPPPWHGENQTLLFALSDQN
ncbi:hypothetical protein EMIHUDRAFT_361623 [Emiliania huxleyi CCMP1516]|uniref:Uncharacterized protein n=2 Tax=Emiliania huxleyi TaxID=2903 RepID=A0A0D3KST4_EMIH1|nr:hypothetical protein EMIHUDRAFT_361623 [Emiliania huxleyi CCMP1516]EOD38819.1 hypothetical protein EMIHUDRAFT_361623 [Emiliania huxleyi CCMP1516]|eukprot:XP_005791248.1 hypothetical protein EMIHUDRAFT_361623 [Emiliania huxleyi CCMP1516]